MAKKDKNKGVPPVNPEDIHPQNSTEYVRRGWMYYAKKEYEKAENDFHAALDDRPDDVDTLYALGLTQKNLGRDADAVQTFEQVIALAAIIPDKVRSSMVVRLAKGHINEISHGDWNLEKETWEKNP